MTRITTDQDRGRGVERIAVGPLIFESSACPMCRGQRRVKGAICPRCQGLGATTIQVSTPKVPDDGHP